MRALKSYGIAAFLIIGVALWLGTGVLIQGGKGPILGEVTVVSALEKDGGPLTDVVQSSGLAKPVHHEEGANDPALSIAERAKFAEAETGTLRSVRTRTYTVQLMPLEITLRGHTSALASVNATARTSDIVRTMDVKEGQSVNIGDLICSLDNGTRQASVDQADAALSQTKAALDKARNDSKTNKALREKGLASINSAEGFATNLRAAEANFQAASVALRNREVELGNTEIRATVPGIIQRPLAEIGDLMGNGQSCATIVQLDPMIFVGAVPQVHVGLAKRGLKAEIRTITGEISDGVVNFVAVSADPATRSFAIEIEFKNPQRRILDGLTAEAVVNLGAVPAHLIAQSVMTLDPDGNIGVRAVEDSKVVFYKIRILKDTRDGIWVAGLPQSTDVIVLGQEYVTAGQIVAASPEE